MSHAERHIRCFLRSKSSLITSTTNASVHREQGMEKFPEILLRFRAFNSTFLSRKRSGFSPLHLVQLSGKLQLGPHPPQPLNFVIFQLPESLTAQFYVTPSICSGAGEYTHGGGFVAFKLCPEVCLFFFFWWEGEEEECSRGIHRTFQNRTEILSAVSFAFEIPFFSWKGPETHFRRRGLLLYLISKHIHNNF